MSVRQTRCPACNGTQFNVIKEHEPETTSMNMRVTLQCTSNSGCEYIWEDRIMSHYTRQQMGRGLRI